MATKRKRRRANTTDKSPKAVENNTQRDVGNSSANQAVQKSKKEKGAAKSSSKRTKERTSLKEYIAQARQFLREVKVELKKVTWPSRKEAVGTTAVVLVLVGILAVYLGLVDAGLTKALTTIMR